MKKEKLKNVFIGCSGYYYPQWKGKFYPSTTSPKSWLQYYSTVFNTVELNGTFYRIPKITDLKRYYESTPEEFTFAVKANRYITHIKRLKESKNVIEEFTHLIYQGLSTKCKHILFQFSPSFTYSEENINLIVENIPHSPYNVIELRNVSWWNEDVKKTFRKYNYTFCNVDYPHLPQEFIHTSKKFYLRLHGTPDLFKSSYTIRFLKKLVLKIPNNIESYFIYFNNTYYEAAYKNAYILKKLLK